MLLSPIVLLVFQMVNSRAGIAFLAFRNKVSEMVGVPRRLPDQGVHQDTAIDSDDIIPHLDDVFPPRSFHVIFQLNAQRPVVITTR
jgi:hypothetical protein